MPSIVVLYHYSHPDDVVSARHYADFCADLCRLGWHVEAWPCTRGCRAENISYPLEERWAGVSFRRVWRPRFRQNSTLGRLANAFWMIGAWCARIWQSRRQPFDIIFIGTDPPLSVLVAWFARRCHGRSRVVHWCFDLYPEAPIADGMMRLDGWMARSLQGMLGSAYRCCDLIVDLGDCMAARLTSYRSPARTATLVPWALAEPQCIPAARPEMHRLLFKGAALGLLYSGNFGRAHDHELFLKLSERLRDADVHFCFSARGNRAADLHAAISTQHRNVTRGEFVPEADLEAHLAAADIHLVSLRPEWTGVVVPSKFFGALAAGRPVLFAGSRDSAVAHWIKHHRLGWVLDDESIESVAVELRALATAPSQLANLQSHCHAVYHAHFSRQHTMSDWNRVLRDLVNRATAIPPSEGGVP